jgi:hypothetical protein
MAVLHRTATRNPVNMRRYLTELLVTQETSISVKHLIVDHKGMHKMKTRKYNAVAPRMLPNTGTRSSSCSAHRQQQLAVEPRKWFSILYDRNLNIYFFSDWTLTATYLSILTAKECRKLTPAPPIFKLLLHSFLDSHMATPPSSSPRSSIHLFIPREICHHRIPWAKEEGETTPAWQITHSPLVTLMKRANRADKCEQKCKDTALS